MIKVYLYLILYACEHRLIPGEPSLWLLFSWPGYINLTLFSSLTLSVIVPISWVPLQVSHPVTTARLLWGL